MTELVFARVGEAPLREVSLRVGTGMFVVTATSREAGERLVTLTAGQRGPRYGTVTIDGKSPSSEPTLRQRIGSLFAVEHLPRAATVRRSCEYVLLAHGVLEGDLAKNQQEPSGDAPALHPWELMDSWGLTPKLDLPQEQLTASERRAVALAIALTLPQLSLLALFEPLGLPVSVDTAAVINILASHATRIPVLCVVTSAHHAKRLGGPQGLLEGGRLRSRPPPTAPRATLRAEGLGLRHCTEPLLLCPFVSRVTVSTDTQQGESLTIDTSDPSSTSRLLVSTALQNGSQIWSLITEDA